MANEDKTDATKEDDKAGAEEAVDLSPKATPEQLAMEAKGTADEMSSQKMGNLATLVALIAFIGGPILAFIFGEIFNLGTVALFTIILLGILILIAFVLPGLLGMSQKVAGVINQVRSADLVTKPQLRSIQNAAVKKAKHKVGAGRSSIQDVVYDDITNISIAFDGRELIVAKDPSRNTNPWIPLPQILKINVRGVRGKLLGTYTCVGALYLDHNTVLTQLKMPIEDLCDRVIDATEHAFDVAAAPMSHQEVALVMLDAAQRALGFTTVINFAVSKGKVEAGNQDDDRTTLLD